ncbi:uncharacterized protein [Littorina saxatilis]|uniref:uncharacterized protein n=1 Tax=Littorina saxatilis TaxID=31220 RepID=UPI0038B5C7ED
MATNSSSSSDANTTPQPASTDLRNQCPHCEQVFTQNYNLNVHVNEAHNKARPFLCAMCGKSFSRKHGLARHENSNKNCQDAASRTPPPPVPTGGQKRKSSPSQDAPPPKKGLNKRSLEKEKIKKLPFEERQMYEKHWNSVKSHKRPGKLQSTYTILWNPCSDFPDWDESLLDLFHEQNKRFKINFSHSFLLKNKESGDLSFFHASVNNHSVLQRPRLINSKQDFLSFLGEISDHDILEQVRLERPNSRYAVHTIMSSSFYVTPLTDFPIGCACGSLPDYITNTPFLHKLQKDQNQHFPYTDGLCLFRCLALHKGASRHSLQKPTKTLFKQWAGHSPPVHFSGVTLFQLESIESEFKVNIDVFEFDENQTPVCLVPLRRSAYKHSGVMRLLRYKDHFMYILDIDKLGHALACSKCGKLWSSLSQMNRHEQTCQGEGSKETLKGGVYSPPQNIFQQLQNHGVQVATDFVFPYRATFDFEVFFDTDNLPQTKSAESNCTQYTAKHIPLSVSVCSNVPHFTEPTCFVSKGDPQELVDNMVNYLERISETSCALLCEEFKDVFDQLTEIEETQQQETDSLNIPVERLRQKLYEYLQELPVVGFNSSRYDLNVIKPFLIEKFVKDKTAHNDLPKDDSQTDPVFEPDGFDTVGEEESGGGTNTGFKTDGKSMFTYSQTRKSLSFFYIKRVIASDGVSTLPTPV